MEMLTSSAAGGFSHESIAVAAGMGARTVYRHFPDRAELLQALWLRLRDRTDTKFPAREEEIAAFLRSGFRSFDEHESLVRAILSSAAGIEVRERGGVEGRAAFARSLSELLTGRNATERARIIAAFVAIYSAPFWQLLRDRGQLTGPQAGDAGAWLIEVLLNELRKSKKRGKHERTNKKKR
jgi:AcrR family transcriptional regulator